MCVTGGDPMGYALMDKVCEQWGDLPGNAYKVLFTMAHDADDDEPTYSGGWQRLAMVLGHRDWPADGDESPEAVRFRRSAYEAVRRAICDTRAAGAITIITVRAGVPTRYVLHLDRPRYNVAHPVLGES